MFPFLIQLTLGLNYSCNTHFDRLIFNFENKIIGPILKMLMSKWLHITIHMIIYTFIMELT
jgi:hypothetical protein